MIDITVDDNVIEIDSDKIYGPFGKDNLTIIIERIINGCKYSGESIILFKAINSKEKKLIEEW